MSHLVEKIEILTPQQVAAVDEFVDLLIAHGQERALAHAAAAVSEPAFSAVWNNPEDDAYDAI